MGVLEQEQSRRGRGAKRVLEGEGVAVADAPEPADVQQAGLSGLVAQSSLPSPESR